MGRTEGKNGSFIAMRMRIHQKLCPSLTPFVDLKTTEAGGYAQISDCYVHIWCICYCFCIGGHSLGALVYLKTKLNSGIISVVFFSCFKKFKCLGNVLDYVIPITVCHIEVPYFGRFYNISQLPT